MSVLDSVLLPKVSSGLITVDRISHWDDLAEYRPAWRSLCNDGSTQSYFSSWEWAQAWWKIYGERHQLFMLICRDEQHHVIAIMPLYRSQDEKRKRALRTLRWIGDGTDDVDGFGPLVMHGKESAAAAALFDCLSQHDEEWDLLELGSMPEESIAAQAIDVEAKQRGWIGKKTWLPRRVIHLPETWDDYLRALSGRTRKKLLHRIRTVENDFHVKLRLCQTTEEVQNGLQSMFKLHQARWIARGSSGKFAMQARRDFYTDVCRYQESLDLWELSLNGQVVAVRLGFRAKHIRHSVIHAMDPKFAAYGVGAVIEAMVIKECIARGDRFFDYLSGDELYKSNNGARAHRYVSLNIARPRTQAALRLKAGSVLERAKHAMRSHVPSLFGMIKHAKRASSTVLKEHAVKSSTRTSSSIEVRILRDLATLEQSWNQQLDACSQSSVFQCWEWVQAWLRAYGPRDLFVMAGFDADRLIGMMPLYVSRWPGSGGKLRVLRLLADSPDDAGALGVIVEAGREEEFCRTALDWLSANRAGWHAIELDHLFPSPANSALLGALKERGWTSRCRHTRHALLELLPASPGLAVRNDVKRASKRLSAHAVEYRSIQGTAGVASALESLFRLHEQRWAAKGKKGAFASGERRDFYRILAASMSCTGALDLWTMEIDGKTVAVEFGLVRGDTRYSMQAGFDPAFARSQVGMLLDVRIIESALARGLRYCDFLHGQQDYKVSLGVGSSQYLNIRCAPPRSPGAAWVRASSMPALQKLWSLTGRSGVPKPI